MGSTGPTFICSIKKTWCLASSKSVGLLPSWILDMHSGQIWKSLWGKERMHQCWMFHPLDCMSSCRIRTSYAAILGFPRGKQSTLRAGEWIFINQIVYQPTIFRGVLAQIQRMTPNDQPTVSHYQRSWCWLPPIDPGIWTKHCGGAERGHELIGIVQEGPPVWYPKIGKLVDA